VHPELISRPSSLLRSIFTLLAIVPWLAACDDLPAPASFEVRESVEQLHVTHAEPGHALVVLDSESEVVAEGEVDAWGGLMFRQLEPGEGYVVRDVSTDPVQETGGLEVISVEESQPEPDFYSGQVLEPGFNYIRTRDGTLLSAYVQLPGPPENGPYPTIVGYSGYEPSKPGERLDLSSVFTPAQQDAICTALSVLCDAPNHPAGLIGGIFGFATVGVNIRGTGCSGGAFDYWETLQVLDGYDMIETIAAQDWVLNNQVGMAGLSYPGISQLFVAQAQPPGLAAIAPLSVIAGTSTSVLAPGGIFNDGFAFQWGTRVVDSAQPYGQGWEQAQVDREAEEGVDTCAENQLLHGQSVDAIQKALDTPFYVPEVVDPLNPSSFVHKIEVPVFLSGAWQDEQTGGHFAALLDRFTNSPMTRFTVFNGHHPDGYTPQVLAEWKSFFDIYVGHQVPSVHSLILQFSGLLFEEQFGVALSLPELPFADSADAEEARERFEAQQQVRVIFENGVADELYPDPNDPEDEGALGQPAGAFDVWFDQWPPAETTPHRLYLNADGSLRETPPEEEGESASSFTHDPGAGQRTLGGTQPFYEWAPTPDGKAVVFVSDPLAEDVVMVGHASIDLHIQSTAQDADLEVILSEVRDDGNETYVQAGWLRASQRFLSPQATLYRPVKTHREADARTLPAGEWAAARVELFPFAHVFRAGSRIRIQIDTPGDSRELWRFMLLEYEEEVTNYVAHSALHPSSVLLPVIPDVEVPTDPPPCPGLRAQPCRAWEPYYNDLKVE
jgi:hypothetical protein